jgi:hypothetical protein
VLVQSNLRGLVVHHGMLKVPRSVLNGFLDEDWGRLIDNLVTLTPIVDYNNQIADLLKTG